MLRVVLKPREDRRIRNGHLWVFSNEIAKVEDQGGTLVPGALAELVTSANQPLGWGYYNKNSLIALRLLERAGVRPVRPLLEERLKAALEFRRATLPGLECFRLVHGEGDHLPGLVIDVYGRTAVVQLLTAGMELLREDILGALATVLAPECVVLKNDAPIRKLEGLDQSVEVVHGALTGPLAVTMDGLKFEVDLLDGQKTGFFLDQRENRLALARFAKDKRVLDVFSHQGAWGLYALQAGARNATFIDSSAPALELARRGAEANGFTGRTSARPGDAFEVLRAAGEAGERWDVVVVDPPAFAKSKKDLTQARAAYERVNKLALRVLAPGGILATSTCSYHVNAEEFLGAVARALFATGRSGRLLEVRGQAIDHAALFAMPEGSYLKCAILHVP